MGLGVGRNGQGVGSGCLWKQRHKWTARDGMTGVRWDLDETRTPDMSRYGSSRRIRHDTPIKRESRGWRGSREPRSDTDGAGFIRPVFTMSPLRNPLNKFSLSPPQSLLSSPSLPDYISTPLVQSWPPLAPRRVPTSTHPWVRDPRLVLPTCMSWPSARRLVLRRVHPPPHPTQAPWPIQQVQPRCTRIRRYNLLRYHPTRPQRHQVWPACALCRLLPPPLPPRVRLSRPALFLNPRSIVRSRTRHY